MAARLHLLPNSSAAASAAAAFPDDAIAHIADAFTEGPVPPLESSPTLLDWLEERLEYWSNLPAAVSITDADAKAANKNFCDAFDRFDEFDDVVLWVADGLGEGLFACWAIAAADAAGFDTTRWRMGQPLVEAMLGRWAYLGACDPENFEGGTCTQWRDAELDAARSAWRAFTSSSPEPLLDLVSDLPDIDVLNSLPYILERYPDSETGLDIWEQRLLARLSQHEESTVRSIGNVLVSGWEDKPDHIGDGTLFHRLLELSDPDEPRALLHRTGTGESMRTTSFALTKYGDAVRDGARNRIDLVGFDRWIGGVHLSSEESAIWWRDNGTLER